MLKKKKSAKPGKKKPLFAKYLTVQDLPTEGKNVAGGGKRPRPTASGITDVDAPTTLKYPSDSEDSVYG